jgi:GTP-binding protein
MSALQGEGVEALVPAAMEAYRRWDRRITTGTLNQWIAAVQRHTPPPRGATIKFGSQVSNRPPKFLFFSNGTQQVPEHYIRFLSKSLRDEFDMGGVPLRVKVVPKEKRGSTKKRSQRKGKGSAR